MDEVNKFAHEGGDTAPGTREQIAARNAAHDKLAEAAAGVSEAAAEAREAAATALKEAEDAYHEAVPTPEVVPPSDSPAATPTATKSSAAKSSG